MSQSFEHPEYGEIKKGDRFRIMITGMIGSYTAKVVDFDDIRGGTPILKVENDETWPQLKNGDYIIQERINAANN